MGEGVVPAQAGTGQDVVVGRHFKMIFLVVTSLTTVMFGVDVALSVLMEHPNARVETLIATCDTMGKLGFGAIVGLVGGKASA
jgi:hypothetical protein